MRTSANNVVVATDPEAPRGSPSADAAEIAEHDRLGPDAAGVAPVSDDTDAARRIGELQPDLELVMVEVGGSAFADLLQVLASTDSATGSRWAARIGNQVLFAFEGPDRVSAASDLLSVLAGARLVVRQAGVSQMMPTSELIDQARRMSPEIRRTRMARDAHDALQ
jgi:hypothetical protein